ncbi:MAG: tetratricopeptide repeat protein [Anaerolineae bacterium]|nr:tetratricopeptide repeat protein [Anaerolineae bacterium]NUQ02506.1 tetratricopeptide repeat protein [Anaerolineae bacterium]
MQIARALRSNLNTDERVHLLLMRARVRLKTGRIDEALLDLGKVQSLNSKCFEQPQVLELLADCHLARFELATVGFADRSDTDKARHLYGRILADHPNYNNIGWIQYQLGRVLLTEYRSEEATNCFHAALLEASDVAALTAYCYERLGFIDFYELRQIDRALQFFAKAVDTYPVSEDPYWLVQVHVLRSRALREARRIDEAVSAARTAVEIALTIESRRGLADALLSISETLSPLVDHERETIHFLLQFVQISRKPPGIDVTWARVHEMLGDAYYRTGQHASALAAYEAALNYNPYSPWKMSLYYRLAKSAYQVGEFRRALQALERLVRDAESEDEAIRDHRIFFLMGNSLYALSRFEEAVSSYEKALTLADEDNPDTQQMRHYLRIATGFSRHV